MADILLTTASEGEFSSKVVITWQDDGSSFYFVKRRLAATGGAFSTIDTVSSLTYDDTSAVLDVHYDYNIHSFNGNQSIEPVEGWATVQLNCLTVSSSTPGGTWQGHPLCAGSRDEGDTPCTGDIDAGTNISIIATPDSNYVVSNWLVVTTGDPLTPTFSGDPSVEETASFTYLDSYGDVDIVISFSPVPCELTLRVNGGNGCINLTSPNTKGIGCTENSVVIIDASLGDTTTIGVEAVPAGGYSVVEWVLDGIVHGATNVPPTFSTLTESERLLEVSFELITCVADKQLTVNIDGNGSVNPSTGLYCPFDPPSVPALRLIPTPALGSIFSGWEYDTTPDITEDGIVLVVEMKTDRTVKAIFEEVEGTEGLVELAEQSQLFYCSSETYKDNIISFSFTNNVDTNINPSTGYTFYFRVNFYSDVLETKLVYSAFSLIDDKRWFLDDGFFSQLSTNGLSIDDGQIVNIIYDPEVLPQQITESQKPHVINTTTNDVIIYEKPLMCGIKYYVKVQAYELSTNSFSDVETIPIILDCNRVDSYYWNYNKDKNNWLCSGQGKMDLQVTTSLGQSINPSISSNLFGTFQIVWQGRKISGNNIYSAKWDSSNDILYSSGQGLYDVLELVDANYPIILTDYANNFYITGHVEDKIRYKACGLNVCEGRIIDVDPGGTSNFERFCYPRETSFLSGSYDEIKVRVYQEDQAGSLVVNDEKVISVVNKKSIRLDVDGIVGAYAVRLRNIEDSRWGDWINIDGGLYYTGIEGDVIGEDDIHHDAFKIDNSRFIVPWDIQSNNGLRRICCQVLTLYGISNTFCLDVLANFDVPQHVFKFYTKEARLVEDEFPIYKGQYVLSVANATVLVNDENGEGGTVYFDAIFSQEIFRDETEGTPYVDDEIRFNVVQQGINDKRDLGLTVGSDNKTFSGEFNIYKEDGIFNKDGAAFIEIILPGTKAAEICGSDNTDKYNIVNTDLEEIANIDLLPEEVYQKYQSDQLSKALDINKFKQKYDKDDINFKFGNPGHYKD